MNTAVDPQTYVTACHEAGHAIAALLRGGELLSVSIMPTREHLGKTRSRGNPSDNSFVTYAGPWAEARGGWAIETAVRDPENFGSTFSDVLILAQESNRQEMKQYRKECVADRRIARTVGYPLDLKYREALWQRVLEGQWPVIQFVAGLLLTGTFSATDITAAFDDFGLN